MFPPVLGSVADALGGNTQKAFFIPLIGFLIAWTFPVYLNLFRAKSLDGWAEKVRIGLVEKSDEESIVVDANVDAKPGGEKVDEVGEVEEVENWDKKE